MVKVTLKDFDATIAFKRKTLDEGYKYASRAWPHSNTTIDDSGISEAIRTYIAEAYLEGALQHSEEFKALKDKLAK